ncbi:IS66 family insertion sequence element accessory protein TnpB, partial [Ralstonia mannitolilytica]|uniref:IS66 family insertion sequence element accessory protein TnpB n=1 Tax=Ralstonia mannitolilytica TaxID=105219 RepID=UPI00292E1709
MPRPVAGRYGFHIVAWHECKPQHGRMVFCCVVRLNRYLFANKSSTRMKVLVYDGFGIWLAARRLNKGRFI